MTTAAPKTATKTAYHILKVSRAKTSALDANTVSGSGSRRHDEYELVAQDVIANNGANAIRLYAEDVAADNTTLDGAGVYVAIPSRSFKPTVVHVATTTTVKVSSG